jgi:phage-related minor tail protein
MASNQVNINLSLQDQAGSIKQRTDEVKGLNKELQKAQKMAETTKTGAKALAASYSASENIEYGRARGSMGSTGASGRDFANQAQGLGGLVRLYATYAANVFAVSAAFSALSNAMDTTNMVRGLDQLGAASGVAMGGLAKRFTEASGGAISLRESMEATAKAISSGMTQKQFLQLGDVAKKASQALGVNMSDAVSRLTRGITKLEPELLDELGLFTKVGKSSEDYARSVGKSVDSLTDFEKRQAFANAVLKEGIDKFNEIDIPTNPYDKLLASLKNIAQTILEVLNKAFGPLVAVLSASPAALTAGIAALGSMIVKQAIPNIVNYREELRKTAEMSSKLTGEKIGQAREILEKRRADILAKQDAAADASSDKIDILEKKLRALSGGRIRKDISDILSPTKSIQDITEKEIEKIDRAGKALKTNSNVYTQLASAIRAAKLEQKEYLVVAAKLKAEENAPLSKMSAPGRLVAAADTQSARASTSRIVSQAADTASLVGFRSAFTEMVDSLKTEKLGTVRTLFTGISATTTAAATRLMGFASALGTAGMVIGVFVGIFQGLNEAFSTNSKEVDKFNQNLEYSSENIKSLTNTYNRYRASLSVDAVIALSTSFTNLSDGINSTVKALDAADKAANGWDRFVDSLKGIFGQDLQSQFAKNISLQIAGGLKGISDPKLKKETEDKLRSILDVTDLTDESINKSLNSLSSKKVIKAGEDIATTFDVAAKAGAKTASSLMSVKDGFKSLETSYTELSNSLIQKDTLSNFGKDLATQGFNLQKAFQDPIATLATLQDVLSDISKMKLLSPESQALLQQNKAEYVDLINKAKEYEAQIKSSEANIVKLKEQAASRLNKAPINAKIASEQGKVSAAETGLTGIRKEMSDISKQFGGVAESSIVRGFQLIEGGFARSIAQAVIGSQKALLDMLPQTAETAKLGAKLENQKIDLQIQQITETQRLIKEMELGRLTAERIHLEEQRDAAIRESRGDSSVRAALETAAAPRLKEIESRSKVLQSTNISADIRAGKLERSPETLKAMQEQQGTISQTTQLRQQQVMNTIGAEVKGLQSGFEAAKKKLDNDLKSIINNKEAELRGAEFSAKTLEDQQAVINKYVEQEDAIKRVLNSLDNVRESATSNLIVLEAQKREYKDVAGLATKAVQTANEQVTKSTGQFDAAKKTADQERGRKDSLAVNLQTMNQITQTLETQVNLTRILNETDSALVDIQKEVLQTQAELGIITAENYRDQLITLEQMNRAKQRDIKLEQLQNNLIATRLDLAKQLLDPKNAGDIASINAKAEAASQAYLAEVEGVNKVYEAQKKAKSLTEDLSGRQLAYGEVFKQSFEGMADAVIEFTKTGKLNFKGMIDSMIEGLIRYEMQQQAMMAYKAFRPGLMDFVGSIFGNVGNTGSLTGTGPLASAKGNVFDTGLQTFAKGGMFTNSVVSSPTLFKFAQGTGLMGEAGPEAIMPLKRDGNGNLGVRAGGSGGNVDVVVNNYGTEKAETRETVDSRGNRKIEVIIGEMTASEITRNGSSSQKAIRGTFGLQPQLIRR